MPRRKDWTKRPIKPAKENNPAASPPFGSGPLREQIRMALVHALIPAAAASGSPAVGLPVKALVEVIAQYATIHSLTVTTIADNGTRGFVIWRRPATTDAADAESVKATGSDGAPRYTEWLGVVSDGLSVQPIDPNTGLIGGDQTRVQPSIWNSVTVTRAAAALPDVSHVVPERGPHHPYALLVSTYQPVSLCRLESTAAEGGFRLTTLAGSTDRNEPLPSDDPTALLTVSEGLKARFSSAIYRVSCSPDGGFVLAVEAALDRGVPTLFRVELSGRHAVSVVNCPPEHFAFDERDHDFGFFVVMHGVERMNLKTGKSTPVKLTLTIIGCFDIKFVAPHYLLLARLYRILIHNLATNETSILAGGTVPGSNDGDATRSALFQRPFNMRFVRGYDAAPDRLYVADERRIRLVTGSIVGFA